MSLSLTNAFKLTKINALDNASGEKERMSLLTTTSLKELTSSEPTSAIHQPLTTGTNKLDNASLLPPKMPVAKLNANGLPEKNSSKIKISAFQKSFQIMLLTSQNAPAT